VIAAYAAISDFQATDRRVKPAISG
jgi:hypothetical protein